MKSGLPAATGAIGSAATGSDTATPRARAPAAAMVVKIDLDILKFLPQCAGEPASRLVLGGLRHCVPEPGTNATLIRRTCHLSSGQTAQDMSSFHPWRP
jgi:hypothetical protein